MITLIKIQSLCICCGLPIEESRLICKLCEQIIKAKEIEEEK